MTVDPVLSDLDALMWSVDRDPRLRTTITAVAVLDGPVPHRQLWPRVESMTRRIPRLRCRIVAPAAPGLAPQWDSDPEFRLGRHLRRCRLGGHGTHAEVHRLTERLGDEIDPDRPPWSITVVEGLADDATAVVMVCHHAIADGIRGVEIAARLFDPPTGPDDSPGSGARDPLPPRPPRVHADPDQARRAEFRAATAAVRSVIDLTTAATQDPLDVARSAGRLVGSASRQLAPTRAAITGPRDGTARFARLDVDLEALRLGGTRVGGTINDALVAGVVAGVARLRRDQGRPVDHLNVAVPIGWASGPDHPTADDGATGNAWAPSRIRVPCGATTDVLAAAHDALRDAKHEPIVPAFEALAGLARRVPAPLATPMVGRLASTVDVTVSNVVGSPTALRLFDRPVEAFVPFGPLVGTALNVTMLSHAGTAHLGITADTGPFPDLDRLVTAIGDRMTALDSPPPPQDHP